MTYALILPPEFLADLVKIREQKGVSIRKFCLDSIKGEIEYALTGVTFPVKLEIIRE